MARSRSRTRGQYLTMLLGILVLLLYLFPVFWMLSTSLKTRSDVFSIPPQLFPSPVVLGSYIESVLQSPPVLRALLNSLVIASGTLLLTLLLGAPAAYGLARLRLRFTVVITLVLLLAQMLPTINLALPLFVIFTEAGLVDTYLGLILANTALAMPFAVIILRPFFLSVPGELIDAARVDGCTPFGAFRRIALPLVMPGLVTVGALAFVTAWGEFVFGLTLATSEQMQPVSVALNRFIGQYGTRWADLMAVATTAALPVIAIFAGLQRFIVGGLTAGATKE
ncbi:carbohydrate ABC transporter permease [Haloactinomyces albus]|uniref:Multiple sugar transport system permease protein n=1 Tax=Haloactinomyces albus TaxID=1352928 RepID=A0AAE3ZH71_9ACTN|nr:carbohydrate ABC transporter permease [Haloactinomyces albus]MDR7303548.1 multiple sugar transport system permease protein [Haloactinomyces albus]